MYHEYYVNRLKYKTSKIVSLKSAPRGNIYDKNGILLVGNKLTKNLVLTSKNEDEIKNILKQINKLFPNISIKTLCMQDLSLFEKKFLQRILMSILSI